MKKIASKYNNTEKVEWILRIAIFGEFLGHGIFALQLKQGFIDMITSVLRLNAVLAGKLLFTIGVVDVIAAFSILIYPMRLVLIWASLWGLVTGLARPMSGMPIWDFVERWTNWGAPLALLYLKYPFMFKRIKK